MAANSTVHFKMGTVFFYPSANGDVLWDPAFWRMEEIIYILLRTINTVVAVTAIICNSSVVFAVKKTTSRNLLAGYRGFLFSLTISDLLISVTTLARPFTDFLPNTQHTTLNQCRSRTIIRSFTIASYMSALLNLSGMSIDHYVGVFYSLRYHQIMTPKNVRAMIIVSWILSFVVGFFDLLGTIVYFSIQQATFEMPIEEIKEQYPAPKPTMDRVIIDYLFGHNGTRNGTRNSTLLRMVNSSSLLTSLGTRASNVPQLPNPGLNWNLGGKISAGLDDSSNTGVLGFGLPKPGSINPGLGNPNSKQYERVLAGLSGSSKVGFAPTLNNITGISSDGFGSTGSSLFGKFNLGTLGSSLLGRFSNSSLSLGETSKTFDYEYDMSMIGGGRPMSIPISSSVNGAPNIEDVFDIIRESFGNGTSMNTTLSVLKENANNIQSMDWCSYYAMNRRLMEFAVVFLTLIVFIVLMIVYGYIFKEVSAKHGSGSHTTGKIVMTTMILLGTFFVCWIPFISFETVMVLLIRTGMIKRLNTITYQNLMMTNKILSTTLSFHPLASPLIYAIRLRVIRIQIRRALQYICSKSFTELVRARASTIFSSSVPNVLRNVDFRSLRKSIPFMQRQSLSRAVNRPRQSYGACGESIGEFSRKTNDMADGSIRKVVTYQNHSEASVVIPLGGNNDKLLPTTGAYLKHNPPRNSANSSLSDRDSSVFESYRRVTLAQLIPTDIPRHVKRLRDINKSGYASLFVDHFTPVNAQVHRHSVATIEERKKKHTNSASDNSSYSSYSRLFGIIDTPSETKRLPLLTARSRGHSVDETSKFFTKSKYLPVKPRHYHNSLYSSSETTEPISASSVLQKVQEHTRILFDNFPFRNTGNGGLTYHCPPTSFEFRQLDETIV